jgi:hypothetical protein
MLTWNALALEICFLPLALWRRARPLVWLAMVVMHVSILAVVSFTDLSAGMLMVHLFTADSRWLSSLSRDFNLTPFARGAQRNHATATSA